MSLPDVGTACPPDSLQDSLARLRYRKIHLRCTLCHYSWYGSSFMEPCPACANVKQQAASLPASPPVEPPAHDILTEAAHIIAGPRRSSYGPVEDSFDRVATVASVLLTRKLSAPLDGKDVAMFMVAMKLCRETNAHSRDNLVDICGYAALLDQLHGGSQSACQPANPPNPHQDPHHGQTTT